MADDDVATAYSHGRGGAETQSNSTIRDDKRANVEKQPETPEERLVDEEQPMDMVATEAAESTDFPEGGYEAWSCVVGTFMVMAYSFGYINSYGSLQEYYTSTILQAYSQSDVAWIGAMQYFFIFGVGIFAGRAFDLGLFKPLMAFSILLTVL